jgi:hypothetical protein
LHNGKQIHIFLFLPNITRVIEIKVDDMGKARIKYGTDKTYLHVNNCGPKSKKEQILTDYEKN